MRHAGPIGIAQELLAHVPAEFERGNLQSLGLERIAESAQLMESIQPPPALAHQVGIENCGQLPWHEETSPQQIGAGITRSVFENSGVLGRREVLDDFLSDKAQTASQFFERPKKAERVGDARNVVKTWIAAEQFVAAETRERDFQSGAFGREANEVSVDAIDRGPVHRLE